MGPGLVAQVEVANQVGDCRLREFLVAPGLTAKVDSDAAYVRAPDEIKDGKAFLHLYGRGNGRCRPAMFTPSFWRKGGARCLK